MKCPSCYKEGQDGFCAPCSRDLFGKQMVSHILPMDSPQDENLYTFQKNTQRLSISGVQLKYSLRLDGNKLKLTDTGGQFILKPIPHGTYQHLYQAPANEHLCMQLAKQVYKLETPPNALVYFKDGSPAYLVKRFDVLPDGTKRRQEDFAALAGKTPDKKGEFKYDYTYEGIAKLMKQHIPAYAVEVEKFFRLILFNYIIGNGDAHLKNFSVSETSFGDHRLSPTYDLLCSKLHIKDDGDMALELFEDDFTTKAFDSIGFHSQADFKVFGDRIGMISKRIDKELLFMQSQLQPALELIDRSFLEEDFKILLATQLTDYTTKRIGYAFK